MCTSYPSVAFCQFRARDYLPDHSRARYEKCQTYFRRLLTGLEAKRYNSTDVSFIHLDGRIALLHPVESYRDEVVVGDCREDAYMLANTNTLVVLNLLAGIELCLDLYTSCSRCRCLAFGASCESCRGAPPPDTGR